MDASGGTYGREKAASRDGKVIGLIFVAHMASHVYQFALPALFPLMHRVEGLSFTELGMLSTVFFFCSGSGQTPAGFLVDRIGARPVLIGGLILESCATALYGLAPSYPAMLVLAGLAGFGNSIFHPADISILTGSIRPDRMGRAFSTHYLGGFIGYAATPVTMIALGSWFGWREAIFGVGAVGLIVALLMWTQRHALRDDRDAGRAAGNAAAPLSLRKELRVLIQPATVLSFVFFAFMAMGSVGMMQFGATALIALIGIDATFASSAISINLSGVVIGIIIGGLLADRTTRHDALAALTVTLCVALLLVIPAAMPSGAGTLFPLLVAAGLCYGVSCPMRDMVVRSVAPKGAAGKVFGFTYSGMDFGSAVTGAVIGILLDRGMPRVVFVCIALFMLTAVASILAAKMASRRRAAVTA
jgi:predicted MFS family arabinose efflux permease